MESLEEAKEARKSATGREESEEVAVVEERRVERRSIKALCLGLILPVAAECSSISERDDRS